MPGWVGTEYGNKLIRRGYFPVPVRTDDYIYKDAELPYEFYNGSAVMYDGKIHLLGGHNNSTKHYLWSGTAWEEVSILPYNFEGGAAVVYNNKIHILGGINNLTKHYSWDGTQWEEESTLPYDFSYGAAVVYNNKIHILGCESFSYYKAHYSWNGSIWTQESTLPYNFVKGSVVVYNNKIHILGSSMNGCTKGHYSWSGSSWTQESTLPYDFWAGSAVVYNNKIYILGSGEDYKKDYSWDGISWKDESTLPYNFYNGSAVVYDDKIHILGGTNSKNFYYWNGSTTETEGWISYSNLPYGFSKGAAVVYNNKIHIFGGEDNETKHYSWNGSSWTQESTLPYMFFDGSAVVYNNKIHLLGGRLGTKKHYSWNGSTWTQETDIPIELNYNASAVVYNNKIHILGSDCGHYSWDGTQWEEESTLPYGFSYGSAVVYNNKIHILGGNGYDEEHYSWNGTQWTQETDIPYEYFSSRSPAVVYDGKIHILGSWVDNYGQVVNCKKHYSWDGTQWEEESTLPYNFFGGSAVVYNGEINILGGGDSYYDTPNPVYNHCHLEITVIDHGWDFPEEQVYYPHLVYENKRVKNAWMGDINGVARQVLRSEEYYYYPNGLPGDFAASRNATAVYIRDNSVARVYAFGFKFYGRGGYVTDANQWAEIEAWKYYQSTPDDWFMENWDYGTERLTNENPLPMHVSNHGNAIFYDNKVYLLGGIGNTFYNNQNEDGLFYSWVNYGMSTWDKKTNIPYKYGPESRSTVVYDGKIHIFGNPRAADDIIYHETHDDYLSNYHYSWDGTQWTRESDIPYRFRLGSVVVYDGKIHLLGGWTYEYNPDTCVRHYSWDGTNWKEESTLPYGFCQGSAVVYDDKLHIFGGIVNPGGNSSYIDTTNPRKHYVWNGTKWIKQFDLPYDFYQSDAVLIDYPWSNGKREIALIGGGSNTKGTLLTNCLGYFS